MRERHQVLAAAEARARALGQADAVALAALLHPAFHWTAHTGLRLDRDAYVARNTDGRTRWAAQDLGEAEVVVVGDTAVLTTIVRDVVETDDGPVEFRMPMTQTWVRAGEGWLCLAGHAGPRLDSGPGPSGSRDATS